MYISDAIYKAVWANASAPLQDAIDLAQLTGQRPADALEMSVHAIAKGDVIATQEKTKQPLRIKIVGLLAVLLERIDARKASHKVRLLPYC